MIDSERCGTCWSPDPTVLVRYRGLGDPWPGVCTPEAHDAFHDAPERCATEGDDTPASEPDPARGYVPPTYMTTSPPASEPTPSEDIKPMTTAEREAVFQLYVNEVRVGDGEQFARIVRRYEATVSELEDTPASEPTPSLHATFDTHEEDEIDTPASEPKTDSAVGSIPLLGNESHFGFPPMPDTPANEPTPSEERRCMCGAIGEHECAGVVMTGPAASASEPTPSEDDSFLCDCCGETRSDLVLNMAVRYDKLNLLYCNRCDRTAIPRAESDARVAEADAKYTELKWMYDEIAVEHVHLSRCYDEFQEKHIDSADYDELVAKAVAAAVREEREADCKALCRWCREGDVASEWEGKPGHWVHYIGDNGEGAPNIWTCDAQAIRARGDK